MTAEDRLEIPPDLNGRHRHTYEAVFRHPVAHNLEWHDVRSLLAALGDVAEGTNGSLEVTRNGQSVSLHAPKQKDAAVEDVLAVRRFLEQSAAPAVPPPVASGTDLLVVIDHHEAKVSRSPSGARYRVRRPHRACATRAPSNRVLDLDSNPGVRADRWAYLRPTTAAG